MIAYCSPFPWWYPLMTYGSGFLAAVAIFKHPWRKR